MKTKFLWAAKVLGDKRDTQVLIKTVLLLLRNDVWEGRGYSLMYHCTVQCCLHYGGLFCSLVLFAPDSENNRASV